MVILNNFENCRSPSKMKPCTMMGPEIGKKYKRDVKYKMLTGVGAHMQRYRNK
jgi:hypothetical protein